MPVAERYNFWGLDIPFTDRVIAPDPLTRRAVFVNNLPDEFRDKRLVRGLTVKSLWQVTLSLPGQEDGISLFGDQISTADIELMGSRKWGFSRKIRCK